MNTRSLAALAAAALALAGCGGAAASSTTTGETTATGTPVETMAGSTPPPATTSADGCQDVAPPPPSSKQYAAAPKAPVATDGAKLTFETTCGSMTFVLDARLGGVVADSVAGLAADGFYDNLSFHRVVPDFVLQGGDPLGTGGGGPGYSVVQAPPANYVYKLGDLAMAKTQAEPRGTGGSQFFVISGASGEQLPPEYAIIGHASDPDSLATIARIGALAVSDGPPSKPVVILHATVTG